MDGYKKDNGTLLGDHVPVIATFKISGTPIEDEYSPGAQEDFWVGENFKSIQTDYGSEAYLVNVGYKTFITTDDQASEKDIQGAKVVKWKFTPSGSGYTITSGNSCLQMAFKYVKEDTGVRTGRGTALNVFESQTTIGAYKFSKKGVFAADEYLSPSTRYFLVTDNNYENGTTLDTPNNDWLLISEDQKQAYLAYVAAYKEANDVRKNIINNINGYTWVMTDEPELYDELLQILLETKNSNYNNAAENTQELKDIVDVIKNRKGYDVTISEGNKSSDGDWYYATLCLPWNAWVPAGVATYTGSFKQDSGDTRYITLNEYKNTNGKTVIPAGIGGYILKTTTTGTFTFFRTGKSADAPAATNYLKGNPSMENVMPTDTEEGNVYVLAKKSQGLGFYNLAANNAIKHNCAYIVIEPEKVTQIKRVSFLFDDTPTAIDKAETAINANATAVYGVAGEQRSALRRGINIVRMSDGTVRKVAVK